jgi:DNA polymerase-3 subunit beta
MRIVLPREELFRALQQVIGVVERRQTLPVLANVLLQVQGGTLRVTATDLEVELQASVALGEGAEAGECTVSGRKLFDIVRALPDGTKLDLRSKGDKAQLSAGRSRYTLAVLPASEFPSVELGEVVHRVRVAEGSLKSLIELTAFAMAVQDVRYYLNGLLLETRGGVLRAVATDGHRLAVAEAQGVQSSGDRQAIVPRKGVGELQRLVQALEHEVELMMTRNHLRVVLGDAVFTSKLIDGRFPDYEAVIPIGADKQVKVDREEFRSALQRAAILSNEKYRGVRLELAPGTVRVAAGRGGGGDQRRDRGGRAQPRLQRQLPA